MSPIPSTVLIIDDDAAQRLFLSRLVGRHLPDATLVTAPHGVLGVQRAQRHRQQLRLVLLDARMPHLDGQLVAALLRWLFPQLPILPVTGDPLTGATFQALGCQPAIVKGAPEEHYALALAEAIRAPLPPLDRGPLVRAMAEQALQLAREDPVLVARADLRRLLDQLQTIIRRRGESRELAQAAKILRALSELAPAVTMEV